MKLNRVTGQALGGLTAAWHIDNKKILGDDAAGGSWLNEETVIFCNRIHSPSSADIRTYHLPTGRVEIVSAPAPCNILTAGGNRWVAWLGAPTNDSAGGVFGSITSRVGGINTQSVSWDGTIGIIPRYDQGVGLTLYASDGRVTTVPDSDEQFPVQYGLQIFGPASCHWSGRNGITGFNVRVPSVQLGYAHGPQRVEVPTASGIDEWICYWSNSYGGFVVHPYDELKGYVLDREGKMFWHDSMHWNGKIRVSASLTQGELPGHARIIDVDLSAKRTDLRYTTPAQANDGRQDIANTSSRVYITGDYTAVKARKSLSTSLVKPQLGLNEDDIVYRLSMLATNVLEPLKKRFPQLVVKGGFRETNGGIGQHEKGEAVDLQLANQTDTAILEMAKFIRDELPFDQLILNFSNSSKPWVHVSFSPDTQRRDVQTKDLADKFNPGLAIVRPYSGEQAAALLREQKKLDNEILAEMKKAQEREARGQFTPSYGDEVSASGVTVTVQGAGVVSPDEGSGSRDYKSVVECVKKELYNQGIPAGFTNNQAAFAITCRVAWLLADTGAGLCKKTSGDDTIDWKGYKLSTHRICFPDGSSYDILRGYNDRTLLPQWTADGTGAGPEAHIPPINPGSDINMNWVQCSLGKPGTGKSASDPRKIDTQYDTVVKAKIMASWKAIRGVSITTLELEEWYSKASKPRLYSDGIWRVGFNAYLEAEMVPNHGVIDIDLADKGSTNGALL
jgi:hypothetical protein